MGLALAWQRRRHQPLATLLPTRRCPDYRRAHAGRGRPDSRLGEEDVPGDVGAARGGRTVVRGRETVAPSGPDALVRLCSLAGDTWGRATLNPKQCVVLFNFWVPGDGQGVLKSSGHFWKATGLTWKASQCFPGKGPNLGTALPRTPLPSRYCPPVSDSTLCEILLRFPGVLKIAV